MARTALLALLRTRMLAAAPGVYRKQQWIRAHETAASAAKESSASVSSNARVGDRMRGTAITPASAAPRVFAATTDCPDPAAVGQPRNRSRAVDDFAGSPGRAEPHDDALEILCVFGVALQACWRLWRTPPTGRKRPGVPSRVAIHHTMLTRRVEGT